VGVGDLRPTMAGVLWRPSLSPGRAVDGPAVVEQYDSATIVPPGWSALVDESFNLLLERRMP